MPIRSATPTCLLVLSLLSACGGGSEPERAQTWTPTTVSAAPLTQAATAPAVPAPRMRSEAASIAGWRQAPPTAAPHAADPAVQPARLRAHGPTAAQVEAVLDRYADSVADEKTCPWGPIPCDNHYTAGPDQKFHGSMGWHVREDGQVHVDTADLVRLPPVPQAMSVFIRNEATSKDTLHVTVADRVGTTVYVAPKLAPGAATTINWTRTDDSRSGPFRLHLQSGSSAGDRRVDYLVLPLVEAGLAIRGAQSSR